MILEVLENKPAAAATVDVAAGHWTAFLFMLVLMIIFGVGKVARETRTSVRVSSFFHGWMAVYLMLLAFLMSVTTGMSLILLFKTDGQARFDWIPVSLAPLAAAVLGVFGFEFLVRKFIIGFGENKFDLDRTLQDCVDQAVAATLKKEAS